MAKRMNALSPLTVGNQPLPPPPPGNTFSSQFNPYAAGNKRYGAGRLAPNVGPTGDNLGYAERDNKAKARKAAIQRRLRNQQGGDPNYGNGVN